VAAEAPAAVTCAQAGCKVPEGGTCLDGFNPASKCPHYGKPLQIVDAKIAADAALKGVPLPSGEDIDVPDVFQLTRNSLCRIIIIAGAEDSGKTTLIASLYERFQRGSVGEYLFAGCSTAYGFERRCHRARAVSRGTKADTFRTALSAGQRFLHLSLGRVNQPTHRRDLIVSDLAGEYFRQARDSSEDARRLAFIARADHFVMLVDGERLIEPETRAAARMEADQTLRSILEVGHLSNRGYVDVVFTKWDKVLLCPERDAIEAFVADTRTLLNERLASKVGRLRFFKTALRRMPGGATPAGYDIDQLLKPWLEESWLDQSPLETKPAVQSARAFDWFGTAGDAGRDTGALR
jgi:hypothetical protein